MFKKLSKFFAATLVVLFFTTGVTQQASAYQATDGRQSAWSPSLSNATNNNTRTTLPSGLQVTVGVTGNDVKLNSNQSTTKLSARGGLESDFIGGTVIDANGVSIDTFCTSNCTRNTLMRDRGTVTISFSRAVTNPIINIAGIGGDQTNTTNNVTNTMMIWTELELSTPNTTMTLLSSNGNLEVTNSGTYLKPIYDAAAQCHTPNTVGLVAGCGSVRVNGTGTSFSFKVHYNTARGNNNNQLLDDLFMFTVALYDDYGSAPASYDTSITSNMLSDLYIGGGVTADALNVMNAARDPNGDVETTSSFMAYPTGVPAPGLAGSSYVLSVPVTGTATGKLCGWVDWDGSGTFSDSTERQCTDIAAGTATKTLTWTVPSGTTYTTSWVRLRVSYGTSLLSAVGRIDNGEIEDYSIAAVQKVPPTANPQTMNVQQFGSGVFTTITGTGGLATKGTDNLNTSLTCLVDPASTATPPACGTSVTTSDGTYTLVRTTGLVTYVNNGTAPQTAVSITYRVTSTGGLSATSTLTPVITPPTAPTARPSTLTVAQNATGVFATITGSGGLTTRGTATITNSLTCLVDPASVNTPPDCGTTVTSPDGTYTLNPTTGVVTYVNNGTLPAAGFAITYIITDAAGLTATSTLTPTVTTTPPPPANPPTASPETITVAQNATGTFSALTGAGGMSAAGTASIDPALTCLVDPASVSTPPACGLTVTTTDGTYTLDPATGIVTYVNNGTVPAGPVTLTYRVTDTAGLTATSTLTISVTAVVTPPPAPAPTPAPTPAPVQPVTPVVPVRKPIAAPDYKSGKQNQDITLVPVGNDTPGDVELVPTSIALCGSACEMLTPGSPDHASLQAKPVVTEQGTWKIDLASGNVIFTPAKNWFGTASIEYIMFDAAGNQVKSMLSIDIPNEIVEPVEEELAYTGVDELPATIAVSIALIALGLVLRRRFSQN